jgi:NADH-quinone oxidoreductase subunit D
MNKENYTVIGVMSGTSLDGIDLAHIKFNHLNNKWTFEILECETEIGYLHRGFEKMCEQRTWNHVVPYTDRLNYISPLINNVGFALAAERLLDIQAPERCQYIRMIMSEISRMTDHFTCLGMAAAEAGAITVAFYALEARETLFDIVTEVTGARLTVSYTRVGGVTQDLPAGFAERVRKAFVDLRAVRLTVTSSEEPYFH